jgi:hypothetical protein
MPVGEQNDRDLFPRQRHLELLKENKMPNGVVHCGNKADIIHRWIWGGPWVPAAISAAGRAVPTRRDRDRIGSRQDFSGSRQEGCIMKISNASVFLTIAMFAPAPSPAKADPLMPATGPYTPSLMTVWPNNTPLAFGMDVENASRALGTPLRYISGRRGNEIYLAIRDTSGTILFSRRDPLYLQFRKGRLTGWKGDNRYNTPFWLW